MAKQTWKRGAPKMTHSEFIDTIMENVQRLPQDKLMDLVELTDSWLKKDKRAHLRKAVQVPIKVVKDEELFSEVTSDLSCGGVSFTTDNQKKFKTNQKIVLIVNLSKSGQSCKLNGTVVRKINQGIAVQFEEMTPAITYMIEDELQKTG